MAGTPVRLRGVLKGDNGEANCTVTALKVTLPGSSDFQYAKISVASTDTPLPVGVYVLQVAGLTHTMQHTAQGHWISAGP